MLKDEGVFKCNHEVRSLNDFNFSGVLTRITACIRKTSVKSSIHTNIPYCHSHNSVPLFFPPRESYFSFNLTGPNTCINLSRFRQGDFAAFLVERKLAYTPLSYTCLNERSEYITTKYFFWGKWKLLFFFATLRYIWGNIKTLHRKASEQLRARG